MQASRADRPHRNAAPAASPRRDADSLVREAEAAYSRKDTAAATNLLDQALALDRRHARANWVVGNIAQDSGKLERAISHYRRALRADSSLIEAHNDLGTAYHAKAWYPQAEACYRDALAIMPGHIAALENLAAALRAQGRLRDARNTYFALLKARVGGTLGKVFRRPPPAAPAVASSSSHPDLDEAVRLFRAQKFAQVERIARDTITRSTIARDAAAQTAAIMARAEHLLGLALLGLQRRPEAFEHLRKAVELRPSVPEFQTALGAALLEDQQHKAALECFRIALALDPDYAPATANVAKILNDLGHYQAAEAGYRESLAQESDLAPLYSSLAGVLINLGRPEDAEQEARRALALDARFPNAWTALAAALRDQGRYLAAEAAIRSALENVQPDGELLREQGLIALRGRADPDAAQRLLEQALALAPDNANVHFNLAEVLLHRGLLEKGWNEYEWRKRMPARARVFATLPFPEWSGEPLRGKRIVVNAEQGLGDEIMFASCVNDLAGQAAGVGLLCARRLEKLFRRSFPSVEIIPGSHHVADDLFAVPAGYDLQVPAGSLPKYFRRSIAEFPRHAGYLKADAARVEYWRERIEALGPGLKVGLSWRGGSSLTGYFRRSLVLENLAELLRVPDVQWVSIQYGPAGDEARNAAAALGVPIVHWQEAVDDLDETAALLCALDLRIGVCNTQIHLAGALGREVWILAPRMPDWRYGNTGDTMPWYPAGRLFRQTETSDWRDPLARLRAALAERAATTGVRRQ